MNNNERLAALKTNGVTIERDYQGRIVTVKNRHGAKIISKVIYRSDSETDLLKVELWGGLIVKRQMDGSFRWSNDHDIDGLYLSQSSGILSWNRSGRTEYLSAAGCAHVQTDGGFDCYNCRRDQLVPTLHPVIYNR